MQNIKAKLLLPPSLRLVPLLLGIFLSLESQAADHPELNNEQLNWLGDQIYNNECSRRIDCLSAWNAGEDFPSLGIGHFIWYQAEQNEIFEESFPLLMHFLESQSIKIPTWIVAESYNSPWQSREDFQADFNQARLTELRFFLQQHIPQQTQFIVQRFEQALDKIIMQSPAVDSAMLEERFLQVANAAPPYGLYALIDYLNFKGEGLSPKEQYQDQGWGLKQVLINMNESQGEPLQQFVISAQQVLRRRVDNSPQQRNEARWLNGWNKRLNTYLPTLKE